MSGHVKFKLQNGFCMYVIKRLRATIHSCR